MVLEKPQGRDRASAEALSEELLDMFEEKQLYRTDHYLAKSVVTSILPFRLVSRGVLVHMLLVCVLLVNVAICVAETLDDAMNIVIQIVDRTFALFFSFKFGCCFVVVVVLFVFVFLWGWGLQSVLCHSKAVRQPGLFSK